MLLTKEQQSQLGKYPIEELPGVVGKKKPGEVTQFPSGYQRPDVPRIESIHEYHILSAQMDDSITELEVQYELLTDTQLARLKSVISHGAGTPALDASELDRQYHLFLGMQKQVVDNHNEIRQGSSVRDIAALVSSFSSLIGLFLKADKELDSIKEEANLKQAVIEALSGLPESSRDMFFRRMSELDASD